MSVLLRSIAAISLLLGASACFYDSRWLQQQQAQQAAFARAKPAELRAAPAPAGGETEIPAKKEGRVLRVRAHASARYAAEVVDWPRQLAGLLGAASDLLGPALGIRIEIAETGAWATRGGEEDLGARLDELAAMDDGRDVDWVIGLLGALPRVEQSYHQLGMGRVPGKHLVMRAMNDAREYEAIERVFARVDEADRRALYKERKQHKTVTVFLHELGHTLGVPHETDPTSIMHARYEPKASGFSAPAVALMRIALAHRLDPAAQSETAFAEALRVELDRSDAGWVPAEHDEMVARLRAFAPPPAPASTHAPARPRPGREVPAEAPAGDPLQALTITDRHAFGRAVAAKDAGRLAEAWQEAKPLFAAYPDVYAVQELRCQIAMAGGVSVAEMQAQCARMMDLTGAPGSKRK